MCVCVPPGEWETGSQRQHASASDMLGRNFRNFAFICFQCSSEFSNRYLIPHLSYLSFKQFIRSSAAPFACHSYGMCLCIFEHRCFTNSCSRLTGLSATTARQSFAIFLFIIFLPLMMTTARRTQNMTTTMTFSLKEIIQT